MFLVTPSGVLDYDLELLVNITAVLDRHITAVAELSVSAGLADEIGLFDRAEHATGLGFAACQTYLASTFGAMRVPKSTALSAGPRHACGKPVVAIVNAAANYWKHQSEWLLQPNHHGRGHAEELLEAVGFPVGTDYPLPGVLAELATPAQARVASLLKYLEEWRDDLRGIEKSRSSGA